MSMENRIRTKLAAAFAPANVTVINDSHQHAGHHGSPGSGESHFQVHIISPHFDGLSRIERHRLVNEALAAELQMGIHALAIKAEPAPA